MVINIKKHFRNRQRGRERNLNKRWQRHKMRPITTPKIKVTELKVRHCQALQATKVCQNRKKRDTTESEMTTKWPHDQTHHAIDQQHFFFSLFFYDAVIKPGIEFPRGFFFFFKDSCAPTPSSDGERHYYRVTPSSERSIKLLSNFLETAEE